MEPKDYEELQDLQRRYEQGEKVDEDRLYELELLNRHRMGDNLTNDEQHDLMLICKERGYEHDQLPNVEEYKAQMGYKSKKGFPKLMQSLVPKKKDPVEHKLDPEGDYFHVQENHEETIDFVHESDGVFADRDSHDDDEDDIRMNTFTVDEEYLQQARSSKQPNRPKVSATDSWPCCKGIAVVLLTTIITVSLILALFPKQHQTVEYHWDQGETDNYLAIRDFVTIQREISHEDAFGTTDSPQYLAAQWLAHGDVMKLPVPNSTDVTFEDRYVMAVLYFSLGGPKWENQVGFLGGGHICTWFEQYTISRGDKEDVVTYGLDGCEGNDKTDPDSYYPRTLSLRKYDHWSTRYRGA